MLSTGAPHIWTSPAGASRASERLRLRDAPLLAAAAAFALGDLAAVEWYPPARLAAVTAALLLLSLIALQRRWKAAFVPVFATIVSIGCWCAQVQPPPHPPPDVQPYADGLLRQVHGRVDRVQALLSPQDEPPALQPWQLEPGAWEQEPQAPQRSRSIDLAVDAIEQVTPDSSVMQPWTGGVRVTLTGADIPLRCGDVVQMETRLRQPDVLRDPGVFNNYERLMRNGVEALGTTRVDTVRVLGREAPGLHCRLVFAQSWAAARLDSFVHSAALARLPVRMRLSASDAAMLSAMLFGDRSALTPSLRLGFERTGTFHLFVVSGLHVSLIAAMVLWLLRRLRVRDLAAVPLTLAVTTAFALFTGFGRPAQRALLMTAAYLLARLFVRRSRPLNALGLAALLVLALDPRALFEAGFQMTVLVILAAAGLAEPVRERLYGPFQFALGRLDETSLDTRTAPRAAAFRVQVRMWTELAGDLLGARLRWLPVWVLRLLFAAADLLLFSTAIELCMVLPLAVYFHRAALLGLPVNMLSIPFAGLLLGLAVAFFGVLLLNAWAALPLAAAVALVLHCLRFLVEHAAHWRGAEMRVPAPSATVCVLACTSLAFAIWALRERSRMIAASGVLAVAVASLAVLWPRTPEFHQGLLEVTAIDVGQGDSLLVVSPEGRTLLIDAGGPAGGQRHSDRWDTGENVVAPFLWERGVSRLDVLALTHAHSDHLGGMPAVLRDLRPRELWLGAEPGDAPALHALLDEAARLDVPVRRLHAGESFAWAGVEASVLSPEAGYANPGAARNDDSLVLEMQFGASRALLEGDAEAASEATMLANQRVGPVTLLKVAHHGSRTSTTEAFLAAAHPQVAVISVGRANTFGHPRREILERLEGIGAKVYRTDRGGAETFLLDRAGRISATQPASNLWR